MRFTVSDFPAKGNKLTSRQIVELAQLCDAIGVDRFAVTDFPFHQDCIALMSACLVSTERLEVESLVTTPFLRAPDVTACSWATMAEVSGGRAILGIGKGGARPPIWVEPWGYERPNGRVAVRELIGVCRDMWAGRKPTFEGKALHTSGLGLDFALAERVPVLVAARGPMMLKVAAELADIVHIASPFLGPAYIGERVDLVRDTAVAAGRSPDDVEIDLTVSLSVSEDREWARGVGRLTTAAAILWVASAERYQREQNAGKIDRPAEFNVPDSTVEAISDGWDMWSGEPLPPHLVDLIDDDVLDRFTIAGNTHECTEKLQRLIGSLPGVTGLRFKLPPLFDDASTTSFREMIASIGEIIGSLRRAS